MKAVIIDDEENARKLLKGDIETNCPFVQVIGEADSVSSGIELIRKLRPEVVFLDVQMNDGTGFHLLEEVESNSFKTIFVTGYDEFAVQAFRFSALDYLLKPVDPAELLRATDRLKTVRSSEDIAKKLNVLMKNISAPDGQCNKLLLHGNEGIHVINIADLVYCKMDSNCVEFFINERPKPIVVSGTLKEFEDFLPASFFRSHRTHLVNLDYIARFIKDDGGHIILKNNMSIPVARRRKEALVRKLEEMQIGITDR